MLPSAHGMSSQNTIFHKEKNQFAYITEIIPLSSNENPPLLLRIGKLMLYGFSEDCFIQKALNRLSVNYELLPEKLKHWKRAAFLPLKL